MLFQLRFVKAPDAKYSLGFQKNIIYHMFDILSFIKGNGMFAS